MSEEFLTKEDLLFDRDENGKILPVIKELKSKKKIKFLPIARGQWVKIVASSKEEKDKDSELLETHLIEPKVKYSELINSGKNALVAEIISVIVKESNKSFGEVEVKGNDVEKKDISMKQD